MALINSIFLRRNFGWRNLWMRRKFTFYTGGLSIDNWLRVNAALAEISKLTISAWKPGTFIESDIWIVDEEADRFASPAKCTVSIDLSNGFFHDRAAARDIRVGKDFSLKSLQDALDQASVWLLGMGSDEK